MSTNNPPIYKHTRGPEYGSLAAWKKFTDESIEMLIGIVLTTATGYSERRLHGSATLAYDEATVIRIGAAVSQIREALKGSNARWLGQHVQETQSRLPAAREDERFQAFLKGMDDEFKKNGGAV